VRNVDNFGGLVSDLGELNGVEEHTMEQDKVCLYHRTMNCTEFCMGPKQDSGV
jgi:hypothetical protein